MNSLVGRQGVSNCFFGFFIYNDSPQFPFSNCYLDYTHLKTKSMKILLTGATGYIGKRLLPILIAEGHHLVCLVRDKRRFVVDESLLPSIEVVEVDLLQPVSSSKVLTDIDAAYFLVHSMKSSTSDFDQLEALTAQNFVAFINQTTAQQIIYLGGIYNDDHLSKHLGSRLNVEHILQSSKVPLSVLRAGIIVGSGSASFEIIRDLVQKLPVMLAPKWLNTKTQPIAVRNVLEYLSGILLHPASYRQIFDIGGPDVMTYKTMLLQYAEACHLKRYIFTVPVLTPRLSSYWLYFVTSTSFTLARNLVESLKNEVIVKFEGIQNIVPTTLLSYQDAVRLAFEKVQHNKVASSWIDAVGASSDLSQISQHLAVPTQGCMIDQRSFEVKSSVEQLLDNIWALGGERGWYVADSLWKIRGFMDKMVGGVGLRRGRRSPTELNAGDALDFWRVLLAEKENRRLLLYAEMKLPGEAWLEFKIIDEPQRGLLLYQTATFRPRGWWGRIYWYLMLPAHAVIFGQMGKRMMRFGE